MNQLPLDLDTESVQFDGQWYTRDALAQRIKAMLDAGDFAVTRPSQALESLTTTLASLRTIDFRATPELADALSAAATRHGKTVGGVIRNALSSLLGLPANEMAVHDLPAPAWHSLDSEVPPVPVRPLEAATVPSNLTPIALTVPAVLAGPGALKAAGVAPPSVVVDRQVMLAEEVSLEDAAQAVSLTPKKSKEEEAVERRWFGG